MPVNRNALIRYKTIDKCLQNRYRKWTLNDLIDACSDALYEYEGIDKGVSKRSVQADIQVMRSDKLGYNAPIVVVERKFYTYEDANYSITNIPLTDQDLGMLTEAVEFLKQFQGFSHFKGLGGMVQKLEDHIYSAKTQTRPLIDFEKNEDLKGLDYLDVFYQAIVHKKPIRIQYQSFKAREERTFNISPYLLKEFRNRWFLIGKENDRVGLINLALDRVLGVEESDDWFRGNEEFNAEEYFRDVIGVSIDSVLGAVEVRLFLDHKLAPYVLTKPLHHSQKVVSRDYYGVAISLWVHQNFELEKEILSFGEGMKVLAPERLKSRIKERLEVAVDQYQTELTAKGLQIAHRQLEHRGYAILPRVYTARELKKILACLDRGLPKSKKPLHVQRRLLQVVPALKRLLFSPNLQHILQQIDPAAFLCKAICFDNPLQSNCSVTWQQDRSISVRERIEADGFTDWTQKDGVTGVCPPVIFNEKGFAIRIHLDEATAQNGALQVLPGSHKKQLSDEEIHLISENSVATTCEVEAGGIQLMKPLLLHASSETKSQRRRRLLHLEFNSLELPGGLAWAEREDMTP